MNIPRGFRRLSVLAGLIGFMLDLFIVVSNWGYWDISMFVAMTAFIVAPVIIILVLGWVVAGFRSN